MLFDSEFFQEFKRTVLWSFKQPPNTGLNCYDWESQYSEWASNALLDLYQAMAFECSWGTLAVDKEKPCYYEV
jgi:hypothetical protein